MQTYWADSYIEKRRTAKAAIGMIKPGNRVFIGSSCGEPQHLVRALAESAPSLSGIEIVRLLSIESAPLTLVAEKSQFQTLSIRSIYMGSVKTEAIARNQRFVTPVPLSAVPRLFKTRMLPLNVALIQASPPDDFGWMSLGISVDITLAAAQSADLVIVQVNPRMPRVLGRGFIHVDQADVVVEHEEDLLTASFPPETEPAQGIARHVARLVEDGSTIQIGLGTTPQATMLALSEKNDLGIHTRYLTDHMMHLVARGVITNRKKGYNEGKMVASSAIGSKTFYEFLDDNPAIEFHPSDYVNDPRVVSRHHRMVAINVVMSMDLTGQAAADAMPHNLFSGVTGILDFMRGAAFADGGKSVLLLPSVSAGGGQSRIVPMLSETAVAVPRGEVQYVVTEYGVVNLFGKSLQERALAMISIAHPDFREELFERAKAMGLLGPERVLRESIRGVYPLKLEEVREFDGVSVAIRPAKPTDARIIQEHYYGLDRRDLVSRFFHERHQFLNKEMEAVSQVDYVKNLVLVAITGEMGFERVVGIGESYLETGSNLAEVAFSVSGDFQNKGIGRALIAKIAEAARENGIPGLVAYTTLENRHMIRLFHSLPFAVATSSSEGMLVLKCRFDKMKEETVLP